MTDPAVVIHAARAGLDGTVRVWAAGPRSSMSDPSVPFSTVLRYAEMELESLAQADAARRPEVLRLKQTCDTPPARSDAVFIAPVPAGLDVDREGLLAVDSPADSARMSWVCSDPRERGIGTN